MKAMILAAGRGERLRPFTQPRPKPLVSLAGQPLIGHHLRRLAAVGFREVVINVAYKAESIRAALGDGRRYGLNIAYSIEDPGALDTGGGVAQALSLLGEEPFALISADIVSDIDYRRLRAGLDAADVHLVLVDNPAHHAQGDFGLVDGRLVSAETRLTYSGVGVFDPAPFARMSRPRFGLVDVIRDAVAADRASGHRHSGHWQDVGRPISLARARQGAPASFDVCHSTVKR